MRVATDDLHSVAGREVNAMTRRMANLKTLCYNVRLSEMERQLQTVDNKVLSVENLSIRLNDRLIVDGLSFGLGQGERLCLLGPSGSGKSMTASAILGLWPATLKLNGSIRINGVEVIRTRATRRPVTARAGMIFQDTHAALNPLTSVGAQLCEPFIRFHGLGRVEAREAVIELLARMMIDEPAKVADRPAPELSGGQRQRICIALALACKPSLIVADEPTTALDVITQAEVLNLLKESTGTDHTPALLFISHDINAAAKLCDRAIIIEGGRMVEHGRLDTIITHPMHRFTQELVSALDNCGLDIVSDDTPWPALIDAAPRLSC